MGCSNVTASRRRQGRRIEGEIRMPEIVALAQEWLAGGVGERIDETIAEVEARAMAAFAEAPERRPGEANMDATDRPNGGPRPTQKRIDVGKRLVGPGARGVDDRDLEHGRRRDQPPRRVDDGLEEARPVRFVVEDRNQG